jgi:hypothetical protein
MLECIRSADEFVSIGWSGAEPHFIELVKSHVKAGTLLTVVGRDASSAEKVMSNLNTLGLKAKEPYTAGFNSFVRSTELGKILV